MTATSQWPEVIDRQRRVLLTRAAMGITAAGAANLFPFDFVRAEEDAEIRSFRVNVLKEAFVDPRRRINAMENAPYRQRARGQIGIAWISSSVLLKF